VSGGQSVHVVVVEPDGIRVEVPTGSTIDQALEAAGWYRPWGGCRAGGCGACTALIVDSEEIAASNVTFETDKYDSASQSGQRYVRVCMAVPTSGMSISFRGGKVRRRNPDA